MGMAGSGILEPNEMLVFGKIRQKIHEDKRFSVEQIVAVLKQVQAGD